MMNKAFVTSGSLYYNRNVRKLDTIQLVKSYHKLRYSYFTAFLTSKLYSAIDLYNNKISAFLRQKYIPYTNGTHILNSVIMKVTTCFT